MNKLKKKLMWSKKLNKTIKYMQRKEGEINLSCSKWDSRYKKRAAGQSAVKDHKASVKTKDKIKTSKIDGEKIAREWKREACTKRVHIRIAQQRRIR